MGAKCSHRQTFTILITFDEIVKLLVMQLFIFLFFPLCTLFSGTLNVTNDNKTADILMHFTP
jgi:hypothetical protein